MNYKNDPQTREVNSLKADPLNKRKLKRDLTKAIMLRPREIYELYGIHPTTISGLCRHADPTRRLPSIKIEGRSGRKGIRLIKHDDLKAYFDRHAKE